MKACTHKEDVARSYQKLPALTGRLPWRDYNDTYKCFLLEDNESLGMCFEITPLSCEARPQAMLEEISQSIAEAIKSAIPCEKENPWILQVYVEKQLDLSRSYKEIESYFNKAPKTQLK